MLSYHPVPPREAFEDKSPSARMTQAALLLSVGAAVGGEPECMPVNELLPLPQPEPMSHPAPIPLGFAVSKLDVSPRDYEVSFAVRMPDEVPARLTRDLYDHPDVETAAGLVEAGMHSESLIVRTAAATAAIDTTGPRDDVRALLEDAAASRDTDVRELARTGLARGWPDHPQLRRYVNRRHEIGRRSKPSHTAVLSHGTWSAKSTWWKPGGDFYQYLDGLVPPLHMHDESFGWSGDYSEAQRSLAANDLAAWIPAQNLNEPDYFAHSHGVTVANIATQRGLRLGRLVCLAAPVHDQWLPDLARVSKIIDIRVRADLVIIADRGGQRLPAHVRNNPKVKELRNGWFRHSAPHEPAYWEEHGLADEL